MASSSLPTALAAEGTVGPPRVPRNPLSRSQIEVVISRSAAVFGLLFFAQTVPEVIRQSSQLSPLSFVVDAAILAGLLASVVASVAKRWVRAANSYIVASWFISMAAWPILVVPEVFDDSARPWLWLLCTVATAAAAVAWPVWAATVTLLAAPLTYAAVRLLPRGGGARIDLVALDCIYATILGGTVLIIITLLRQAAVAVDVAQGAALDRYANAVRQHATEVERVQVDSIVHDSVLTTFLSAARAHTDDAMGLAARMAENAMGYLRDAAITSPDDLARVPVDELAERIESATSTFAVPFDTTVGDLGSVGIPTQASDAVYSAAVQAMVNSAQHAGGRTPRPVRRWLTIDRTPTGLTVVVGDDGAGFDFATLATARIGVRVSIIERVTNASGLVDIVSAPGEGAVVTITWPDPNLPSTAPGELLAERVGYALKPASSGGAATS